MYLFSLIGYDYIRILCTWTANIYIYIYACIYYILDDIQQQIIKKK